MAFIVKYLAIIVPASISTGILFYCQKFIIDFNPSEYTLI